MLNKFEGNINVMTNGAGTGLALMDTFAERGLKLSALIDFTGRTYHE